MIDIDDVFNSSFERINRRLDSFFEAFYVEFVGQSDDIKDRFSGVDMQRQKEMLEVSFNYLVSFYATKQASHYLIDMAKRHNTSYAVSIDMYDIWVDALLLTVKKMDPEYEKGVDLAWRVVIAPGIEFMKRYEG